MKIENKVTYKNHICNFLKSLRNIDFYTFEIDTVKYLLLVEHKTKEVIGAVVAGVEHSSEDGYVILGSDEII